MRVLVVDDEPDATVLLSDIGMPEMDGYELRRQVRERIPAGGRQIPAAALTAYGRSQDRARAFRAGFQTHLSKPVEPVEVQTVVASLAGKID